MKGAAIDGLFVVAGICSGRDRSDIDRYGIGVNGLGIWITL